MNTGFYIASWADAICWAILLLHVLYLLYFAWRGGMFTPWKQTHPLTRNYRFAVFFPAYKEDRVIVGAVRDFLRQAYDAQHYEVIVVADQLQPATLEALRGLPVRVVEVHFEVSSKARALTFAVDQVADTAYDVAVVLDADNTVEPDFLVKMNAFFNTGTRAVQAHRKAKNLNTPTALLDAASEEINNTIFRAGHVRAGLSAALIGSGMAFDYRWFATHIRKAMTAGEDKELEIMLLKERIYIHYLSDVPVYDEKTQQEAAFGNQRRRWLAAQWGAMSRGLRDLPQALWDRNWDYADKLAQWIMLPRLIVIAFLVAGGVLFTLIEPSWGIKWLLLFWVFTLAMAMALPDELTNRKMGRALLRVPFLALRMVLNLFRLRGVNQRFIHTAHGIESNESQGTN